MKKDAIKSLRLSFEIPGFVVERGKIKEFALAIGDQNPLYYEPELAISRGYRDIPIPLTFPTVIEMWSGLSFEEMFQNIGLDPLKVLHGEQKYQYFGEVCAGDRINGYLTVAKVNKKQELTFVNLETELFNQHNEKVILAYSTLIERP